ncbi:MAG: cation-translocating P-type ATPase [Candidatus Lokiarchaeota archaeon]|nr:cation-translocating P-type ATPase [Candidatus Lokiarchaeota archaeon]
MTELKTINAHSEKIEKVVEAFKTSLESGISEAEARVRLEKYGKNELIKEKGKSALQIFVGQFKSFLVYLLFFAIVISIIIGFWESSKHSGAWSSEYTDAIVIFAILIVNAILGFYQEFQAEKSMESLKKLAPHFAKVRRDGKVNEIAVEDIVPGDIALVEEGDKFPADLRLFKEFSFYVDEAILTGESKPVKKHLGVVDDKMILADRTNLGYMNTIVTRGNAEGIVIGTAMNTEIGKIAESLQKEKVGPSPFQIEVNRFGKLLGLIIILICLGVLITEFIIIVATEGLTFSDTEIQELVEALEISISLAVSAVPEGLVVVITVVLSIGMRKMADRNALVRNLTAVETLGRVNVICSDKTGTLTKNEMTVVKIYINEKVLDVEGVGYNIIGDINESGNPIAMNAELKRFLEVCLYCNNSNVNILNKTTGEVSVVGDPTEISMKVLALKKNLSENFEKLDEIPFDSDRKMMSVIGNIDGKTYALIKGAPDVLLKNATSILENGQKKPIGNSADKLANKNEEFARSALRVLGVAYKELEPGYDINDIEKDFIYIGLVGIIDPARDEVKFAINEARMAGIRTIMITGDHRITAIAIAHQIGLTETTEAITGVELEAMSDEELLERVKTTDIFARVTSEHKLRILKKLKDLGLIVAMTGDGVNDAPAVKGSHVGVAMGLKGTEVTQEASDMILIDDNYATIVNAIEEGRGIFETTKGFFRYMLSTNFDEIFLILAAYIVMKLFANIFIGIPVEPIQILWLNIATDGIPAMVLGLTPTDPDVMKNPPRKGFTLLKEIRGPALLLGIYTSITDISLYLILWGVLIPIWSNPLNPLDPALVSGTTIFGITYTAEQYAIALAQTIVFSNLIICELLFVYTCTSNIKPFYKFPNKHLFWATGLSLGLQFLILYTPMGIAFHVIPLTQWYYWVAVLLGAFSVSVVDELRKYRIRLKLRKDPDYLTKINI